MSGSNVATIPRAAGALTTAEHQAAIRTALKTSLYPGASDPSVDMVLSYCAASGLDPMTKPVHIVPMKVSTGQKDANGWDIKENRDVVMPGIGLYRINAARTGLYAGCSEPEFGPTRTLQFKREHWVTEGTRRVKKLIDAEMHYPEWCRVTVRKLLGGTVVDFTAVEYWLENYASKGDDGAPNAMWEKRAFGQLAKCTEAQALRKAFPEAVGSQPTAEEMEGKDYIDVTATVVSQPAIAQPAHPPELPAYPHDQFEANLPAWREMIASGKKDCEQLITMLQSKAKFTPEQLKKIREKPPEKAKVEAPAEAPRDEAPIDWSQPGNAGDAGQAVQP